MRPMRMKWIAFVPIVAFSTAGKGKELADPLSLAEVIDILRRQNPEIIERRERARAASARPGSIQPDDPTLSLEWWQQPISFSQVPIMATVRQPLPWPGKLNARREVALREAATQRDQIAQVGRRLEAEAKRAFFEILLAERRLGINSRVQTLLRAMVASAEAKYRSGQVPQVDILTTQTELLTLDNEGLDLERERNEQRARLNALLNRSSDEPLSLRAAELQPASVLPLSELLDRARTHNPEIALARDALREAESRLALARRETNPELNVWAGYMVMVYGVDTFTAGVSSTLPLFSRQKKTSQIGAAEAEVAALRAALVAQERRTEWALKTALLEIEAAKRHAKLHAEKIIPLAELSLQSASAAYQNGQSELFAVLNAARMVREHHLEHERYLIEQQRWRVELELALGEDLALPEKGL